MHVVTDCQHCCNQFHLFALNFYPVKKQNAKKKLKVSHFLNLIDKSFSIFFKNIIQQLHTCTDSCKFKISIEHLCSD